MTFAKAEKKMSTSYMMRIRQVLFKLQLMSLGGFFFTKTEYLLNITDALDVSIVNVSFTIFHFPLHL